MIEGKLSGIFSYRGRLGRGQYWAGLALVLVVGVVLLGAAGPYLSAAGGSLADAAIVVLLLGAFFWLLSLLMIRRLHDRDMSGWWFVPFAPLPVAMLAGSFEIGDLFETQQVTGSFAVSLRIGAILLLLWGLAALGLRAGTAGGNRFGPAP